ncbi:hypothetical protein C463_14955 [Halorubrum californiense DSM 19288]|uniref:Conditioned medium-induced protein 4 n=1 Tax=Halorubrum californiense DSM 19288 TaxID=1227465 RepID=M0E0Z7_9EURY|nr:MULTISPECIES: hypothetical protein [Halorubrum]ELZ40617.1 hypothetical protein C463_14955 [Halorubrum californiense DSM 19288]TKX65231.1 hypothetical protein EXE40_17040 [Halorubrum sp. GN11GM_10-3_MGM]
MDEKTADLRDLFVDATGSESVTERQAEEPGTIVDRDDEAVDDAVRDLVAAMRDRYGFSTPLDDAAYALVARGRFDGADDAAIAAAIREETEAADGDDEREDEEDSAVDPDGVDAATVRRARLDLHLVRETDREVETDDDADPPFAYADLKQLTAAGNSIVECAEELGAEPDVVAKYAAVARVDLTATQANDRFRDAFRDLLTDADIEGSLASDAREDGLREATEDIETDVSL